MIERQFFSNDSEHEIVWKPNEKYRTTNKIQNIYCLLKQHCYRLPFVLLVKLCNFTLELCKFRSLIPLENCDQIVCEIKLKFGSINVCVKDFDMKEHPLCNCFWIRKLPMNTVHEFE